MSERLKEGLDRLADEVGFVEPDLPAIERLGHRRRLSRYAVTTALIAVVAAAVAVPLYGLTDLGENSKRGTVGPHGRGNGMIVGVCERHTAAGEYATSLCAITPTGDRLGWLTGPGQIDWQPSWSPDGSKIAFRRGDPMYDGDDAGTQIVITDGAGNESVLRLGRGDFASPTWAPDGRTIAYEDQGRIFATSVTEANPVPLTEEPSAAFAAYSPAWSPTGDVIAFSGTSYDPATRSDLQPLYLMNADGTDVRAITDPALMANNPAWSPDGRRLVFTSEADDSLYIVNADGSGVDRLTGFAAGNAAWSPDGRAIVFTARIDGETGLHVMDVGTGVVTHIADGIGDVTWQPVPESASTPIPAEPAAVTVPNVIGLSHDKATAVLEEAGLAVSIEQVSSSTVPEGAIVSTDPAVGTEVDAGSSIVMFVSAETDAGCAPDEARTWQTVMRPWLTSTLMSVGAPEGWVVTRGEVQDTGSALRVAVPEYEGRLDVYVHLGVPDLEHDPRSDMTEVGSVAGAPLYRTENKSGSLEQYLVADSQLWLTLYAYSQPPATTVNWRSPGDAERWLNDAMSFIRAAAPVRCAG